jgi:hypothetical protein
MDSAIQPFHHTSFMMFLNDAQNIFIFCVHTETAVDQLITGGWLGFGFQVSQRSAENHCVTCLWPYRVHRETFSQFQSHLSQQNCIERALAGLDRLPSSQVPTAFLLLPGEFRYITRQQAITVSSKLFCHSIIIVPTHVELYYFYI